MKRALILGANGQDGHYLSALLLKKGVSVTGVARTQAGFLHTDITDFASISALIRDLQPDCIFHLAANSSTRHEVMFENHHTISTGTLNILESVRLFSPQSKIFISGSGLQFVNNNMPIKETDPFEARDAYSVSRIQSVYAARYFRNIFGLKVYIGYFFNHDSPLRSERHVAKKIADAAVRIGGGSNEKLVIGDISTIKEWTFAGDVVEGIFCLINQDAVFEANISSGKGYAIEEWLTACFNIVGKNWRDYVITEPGFTAEYRQLVSDPSVIQQLGWKPVTGLQELAQMMMNKNGQ